jgi:hypothetical protein
MLGGTFLLPSWAKNWMLVDCWVAVRPLLARLYAEPRVSFARPLPAHGRPVLEKLRYVNAQRGE